jgi:hypothetical protein
VVERVEDGAAGVGTSALDGVVGATGVEASALDGVVGTTGKDGGLALLLIKGFSIHINDDPRFVWDSWGSRPGQKKWH